jgi:tetratricopeptide (TPR) repeat protein
MNPGGSPSEQRMRFSPIFKSVAGLCLCVWVSGPRVRAGDAPPGGRDPATIEAEAMGQAAEADRRFKAGDFAAAIPLYQAERDSRAASGDLRYEAYALRAIGCCHFNLGDDDAAVAALLEAARRDARRDDPGFEGYDWLLIGRAHLRRARLVDCVEALRKALPKLSQAVDRDHEADARLALAEALMRLERPQEASPHLDRAEELARLVNDPARLATAWLAASRVATAAGESGLAAERADDARRAFTGLAKAAEAASASYSLGEALADLDRLDAAAAAVENARDAHRKLEDPAAEAEDLALLAAVKADDGDRPAAIAAARAAVEVRRASGDTAGEIDALVALSRYLFLSAEPEVAARTLTAAVNLGRTELTPARLVPLLLLADDVSRRAGLSDPKEDLLREADRVAADADNGALRRMVNEARVARKSGR